MHAAAIWTVSLQQAWERIYDALGQSQTIAITTFVGAAVMFAAVVAVRRGLERIEATQQRIDLAMSASSKAEEMQEIKETLRVSRSAADLLDEFREELLTLQFVRGANAAVIGRLDDAIEKLHTIQEETQVSRGTADTLTGVVREVRDMRLAYAATSRKLDRLTTELAERQSEAEAGAVPEPAYREGTADDSPAQEIVLQQAARRALESFEQDVDNPS